MDEKSQVDIEEMELQMFMEVRPFNQAASPVAVVVTYFELDDDVRSMAETLHTFKESYIFKMCWESQARKSVEDDEYLLEHLDPEDELVITADQIYEQIFQPCYERYQKIYTSLKDGSMTFKEVDAVFKDFKGKYEELATDVATMCGLDDDDRRWIRTRIQQIQQYHELHLAVASAQVVMKVKCTLCLQGDFQVLEKLLEVVSSER